jgi:hypothetical protein
MPAHGASSNANTRVDKPQQLIPCPKYLESKKHNVTTEDLRLAMNMELEEGGTLHDMLVCRLFLHVCSRRVNAAIPHRKL